MPPSVPATDTLELTLVRHARSAHVHAGLLDVHGFERWQAAYDAAGIGDAERAPEALQALVTQGAVVVSSDLPRALASARLLGSHLDREVLVSPLLRELSYAYPSLGGARVPLGAWALTVGLTSLARMLRGTYPTPHERARISEAAGWLRALAVQHRQLVVVTHASFRRQLTNALRRDGWVWARDDRSVRPWSAWRFTRLP